MKFTICSPDGEGGYPGNLEMSVTFTVKNDILTLAYRAVSDKDTVMNFTNHAYFNLGAKNNLSTALQIKADAITPVDSLLIPTGGLMDVTDTEFDFRQPKPIGRDIAGEHPQLKLGGGYDHNFVLSKERGYKKGRGCRLLSRKRHYSYLFDRSSGRAAVHGEYAGRAVRKGRSAAYKKYYAFCLETQFWYRHSQ